MHEHYVVNRSLAPARYKQGGPWHVIPPHTEAPLVQLDAPAFAACMRFCGINAAGLAIGPVRAVVPRDGETLVAAAQRIVREPDTYPTPAPAAPMPMAITASDVEGRANQMVAAKQAELEAAVRKVQEAQRERDTLRVERDALRAERDTLHARVTALSARESELTAMLADLTEPHPKDAALVAAEPQPITQPLTVTAPDPVLRVVLPSVKRSRRGDHQE